MKFIELIPKHSIGDVVVFKEQVKNEEILVQAKILKATAKLENGTYVWTYELEHDDLVHYLESVHIVMNVTKSRYN